jgi:hypothetical protein
MTTEPTAFDQLISFLAAAGFELVPAPRTYTREDMIRFVIGQQWAVAITVLDGEPTTASTLAKMLADLPCAVDVVGGKDGAL